MTFRILHLTFDCADPGALADFWCAVLGYERTPLGLEMVAEAVPPDGVEAPKLLFIKVPEPKTAKNRLHVDFAVPDREPAHGARRDRERQLRSVIPGDVDPVDTFIGPAPHESQVRRHDLASCCTWCPHGRWFSAPTSSVPSRTGS